MTFSSSSAMVSISSSLSPASTSDSTVSDCRMTSTNSA